MNNTLTTIMIILISLVLILGLGTWAYSIYNSNMESANQITKDMEKTNQAIIESQFTQYDATEITGSQLINLIRKYEQENEKICVEVNNGRAVNTFVYTADLASQATLKAKDAKNRADLNTYINPSTDYLGEVVRDENTGTIVKLKFTKV